MKTMRSGYHSFPGSDDRRQPEKIEFFGNFLGTMVFCNYPVDADKWGRFLFDMGVQVESMTALGNQAKTTQQALVNQY
jgi:hypothetical protein